MVGSAAIKQGRSANRKHTYFFFWPKQGFPFKVHSREMSQNRSKREQTFLHAKHYLHLTQL